MSQLAALLDDGVEDDAPQANQLALVVADAPLLPPSVRLLTRDVRAGVKRRQGCGVCRACLFFPNRMACLATQTEAQLAAKAAVKRQTKSKRSQASALERQLDKQQQQQPAQQAPPRPGSAFVPQQACRLCKCADHTAVACPLQTCLSAAAPAVATWADALDPHLRAVLLAVQQVASARVYATCKGKPSRSRFGGLTAEHLQRVEAELRSLRDA